MSDFEQEAMFGREVGAFVSEAVHDTDTAMPETARKDKRIILVLSFDTEAQREQLIEKIEAKRVRKRSGEWTMWWPPGTEPEGPEMTLEGFDFD